MKNEVIHGDCRTYLDRISQDVFFISDPPYNQSYHYDEYKDRMAAEEYATLLLTVFKGRKSSIILYPEETVQLLGGGQDGRHPADSFVGVPKQHRETA
jgi:hypothetical protein